MPPRDSDPGDAPFAPNLAADLSKVLDELEGDGSITIMLLPNGSFVIDPESEEED